MLPFLKNLTRGEAVKTTTTIYDILQSELINMGFDEFRTPTQLTFFDEDYSFIRKVMSYDSDVEKIVNNKFFVGLGLEDKNADRKFKRAFINKFLNRQIAYQTLEGFTSQIVHTFIIHESYINTLFTNLDDYIHGKNVTNTDNTGNTVSDNRNANTTLPQDRVNVDVNDTVLSYADENSISRNKSEQVGTSSSESSKHSLNDLILSNNLIDQLFIEFDKAGFLQIW